MIDLKKEESYAYLMVTNAQDGMGVNIDYEVVPFKSENDVKKAILNIIANNVKNHRDAIRYITYDEAGTSSYFAFAKIEFKSYKSKTYKGIRRKINEVK